MSKELEKAIEVSERILNDLSELASIEEREALLSVIKAAEELIKLRKDIDEGVLVLNGLEAPKWLPTDIEEGGKG